MDSLGTFYKKRLSRVLLFILPIIMACIAAGLIKNDTLITMLIVGSVLCMSIVMFARKPLPGPLGAWQKVWNSIPTWTARRQEMMKEKK